MLVMFYDHTSQLWVGDAQTDGNFKEKQLSQVQPCWQQQHGPYYLSWFGYKMSLVSLGGLCDEDMVLSRGLLSSIWIIRWLNLPME